MSTQVVPAASPSGDFTFDIRERDFDNASLTESLSENFSRGEDVTARMQIKLDKEAVLILAYDDEDQVVGYAYGEYQDLSPVPPSGVMNILLTETPGELSEADQNRVRDGLEAKIAEVAKSMQEWGIRTTRSDR